MSLWDRVGENHAVQLMPHFLLLPLTRKKLVLAENVIQNNQKLMCQSKVPTLALKLAKKGVIFQRGDDGKVHICQ